MQARAERCYTNVTLKAGSQKEAVSFIHFYWDVCLFENMNLYILADYTSNELANGIRCEKVLFKLRLLIAHHPTHFRDTDISLNLKQGFFVHPFL